MKNLFFRIKSKVKGIRPDEWAEYLRSHISLDCGNQCEIHPTVVIGSEPYLIKLGNQVKITAGVKFFTHDGGMWVIRNLSINRRADKMAKIVIGDNVFIGQDTLIMPGVTIGSNVVIGAGSIVTKDIPNDSIALGSPAVVKFSVSEYYQRNIDRIEETKHMNYIEKKEFYLKKFNL